MPEPVEIRRENLAAPAAGPLIKALNTELARQYPEEGANHFRLDAGEVVEGRGAFLIAYADGRPVACGAIRREDAATAEIKRMYVAPEARGRGIGRAVLAALEEEGRRLGVMRIVLETGERQTEALALYASVGFERIPLFGEYIGSPLSVCMAKSVSIVAATYNATADAYDENAFWERFGRSTVDRLELREGMRVLDVCAGSGASAIPAADAVGPRGRVLAVDLADDLLALLRAKAQARGFAHVEVVNADFLRLDLPSAGFDAVVCVFGIFFLDDRQAAVRRLWSCVKPGGRLAITSWGPRFLEPMNTQFWEAVRAEQPDLYKTFNPWDSLTEPQALRDLMTSAGMTNVVVEPESAMHPLPSPSAWWSAVMGTGYRRTIERLPAAARERIKAHNLSHMMSAGITAVETNVVYSVARKDEAAR